MDDTGRNSKNDYERIVKRLDKHKKEIRDLRDAVRTIDEKLSVITKRLDLMHFSNSLKFR